MKEKRTKKPQNSIKHYWTMKANNLPEQEFSHNIFFYTIFLTQKFSLPG